MGDPDRVSRVSRYFDRMEHQIQKREFVTHTGYVGKKHVSVISTGIGTNNIDIVLNELDALANIDLTTREPKAQKKTLQLIRVGTSGCLDARLPLDTLGISENRVGDTLAMKASPTIKWLS